MKKTENKQWSIADVSGSAFKIRMINGRLGISGKDIEFMDIDFFGLKVGQKIVQVGDGRNNGSFRTDSFKCPVEYVGGLVCEFDKPEKMFAFKILENIENEDVFLLYGSTGSEIFTEAIYSREKKESYVRFYQPVFFIS